MMLGMYAEDPLAKQNQHAQSTAVQLQSKNLGADMSVDMLDGELNWFSDGSLIRMEEFGHDIDWVHEELDQSLHLQCTHGDNEDLFAREFSPYAPPTSVISLDSQHHPTASDGLPLSGDLRACEANEKLLMSFDTMSYTSPSPLSSPRQRDMLDDDLLGDEDMEDDEEEDEDDEESTMDANSILSSDAHLHGLMLMPPLKSSSTASPSKPSDKVISSDGKFKKMFEPIVHQRTIGAYTPTARKLRLEKFHEKRKKRIWKKSIKYDCRKKLADDRPRIKGRFVRVLENLVSKSDDDKSEDGLTPALPTNSSTLSDATPPQGNTPMATSLSPTVNSIHFGSFGSFPSPVVMVKLEPPAFPLVGRAILG